MAAAYQQPAASGGNFGAAPNKPMCEIWMILGTCNRMLWDQAHASAFLHTYVLPCPYGQSCLIRVPEHRTRYSHDTELPLCGDPNCQFVGDPGHFTTVRHLPICENLLKEGLLNTRGAHTFFWLGFCAEATTPAHCAQFNHPTTRRPVCPYGMSVVAARYSTYSSHIFRECRIPKQQDWRHYAKYRHTDDPVQLQEARTLADNGLPPFRQVS